MLLTTTTITHLIQVDKSKIINLLQTITTINTVYLLVPCPYSIIVQSLQEVLCLPQVQEEIIRNYCPQFRWKIFPFYRLVIIKKKLIVKFIVIFIIFLIYYIVVANVNE